MGELTPLQRALVRLSGAMARARGLPDPAPGLDEVLREAHGQGEPAAVEEAILQGYLFLGYPAALNTLGRWREITGRPAPGESGWHPEAWEARGEAVCRVVYGGQYPRLRENIRALHPDMEHWMVLEGYGKVLGRPGLDLATRELCIVAILAVQGAVRQLYSHLRGALHAGATPGAVEAALAEAEPFVPEPLRDEVRGVWDSVQRRKRGG